MNTCKKTSTKVSWYSTFVDVFFVAVLIFKGIIAFNHLVFAKLNAFVMIGFL